MKIIDRYIIVTLIKAATVAMVTFLAIIAFLTLIDELGDTGRGNYTTITAIQYVLLVLPRVAYELFPIAAVIGAMATLGILCHNSELVILRTSGVSLVRLAWSLTKGGLLIVLAAVLVGEFVAPVSEQTAQQLRTVAMSEQITLKTRNGFWSRDGDNFINIRKILPGNRIEDIYVYEFDNNNNLKSSTYAQRAEYIKDRWQLENIEKSYLTRTGVTQKVQETESWDALLNPELINLVTIRPQYLTLLELYRYIEYLKSNSQNSLQYQQALWSKLIQPVTIIALILLALPLVKSDSRSISVSQRVLMGSLIGIAFHLFNQIAAQMGVVYSINSIVSATLPTLVVLAITFYMMRRSA
ncbi:MAG: LPS export ABC transporter permease LptG [Gammaproteobacteria bacterium]|nr:LPS export ABC transporter permease LptG [Gammaproteobacteria bacterium]NIN62794.1 LPS export ABC transporter permease LptG [Gammaproteobacteria bacterium]NIO63775.1 LPS export ABC transporter permease LptG [Gammaproteobacteria bacterium]NIP50153.1 LPS export ABC transporter permease LptG [Gammaproteobacteria bacterium]NIQ12371.1 LPS export ABC transporter permease LptG [Gammaproteobacteria bacterium]